MKQVARKQSTRSNVVESGAFPIADSTAVEAPQAATFDPVTSSLEVLEKADRRMRKLYTELASFTALTGMDDEHNNFSSALIQMMKIAAGLEADLQEVEQYLRCVDFGVNETEMPTGIGAQFRNPRAPK